MVTNKSPTLDRSLPKQKAELLYYFRSKATEIVADLEQEHGRKAYKDICADLPGQLKKVRDDILLSVVQTAEREKWPKSDLANSVLLIHHCTNAVMLDTRNSIWTYDYMAFSRRIGEVWESFCHVCIEHSLNGKLVPEVPPVFADVRKHLHNEIAHYISGLPLENSQKAELTEYYRKVWYLVDAGEIRLDLDAHFRIGDVHYNIDFKSGFGSNEKGNTNRLLLVATIYQNIVAGSYRNLILVRSVEEEGNNYLKILKKSGVWSVSCGSEAYQVLAEFTGIDLATWIKNNIDWRNDLSKTTYEHLEKTDLAKYLKW